MLLLLLINCVLAENTFIQTNYSKVQLGLVASKPNIVLGNTYLANGEIDKAIDIFNKTIDLNDDDISAYDGRAFAFVNKGDFDKALHDYSQIIYINRTNASAYLNRGNIYRFKCDYEKAIADFNECIRLDQTNSIAYYSRASAYCMKGEYDKAVNDCSKSLQLSPNNDKVFVMRGVYFSRLGHFSKAIADFRRAISINTENSDAYNNLAWLFATCADASLRNGKDAVEAATKACKLTNWEDWKCLDTLAAAFTETRDYNSAIKYVNQAINTTCMTKDGLLLLKQHLSFYEKQQSFHVDY